MSPTPSPATTLSRRSVAGRPSGVAVVRPSVCHRWSLSGRVRRLKRSQCSRFACLAGTPPLDLRLPVGSTGCGEMKTKKRPMFTQTWALKMVLPTGVSPRIGQASRQRFSGCGERRCAYKLRLSAAMYAQMYAQTWGQQSALP